MDMMQDALNARIGFHDARNNDFLQCIMVMQVLRDRILSINVQYLHRDEVHRRNDSFTSLQ